MLLYSAETQTTRFEKRHSYTSGLKQSVVSWDLKNGKNVSKIYLHFNVDQKQVHTWVAKEPSIREIKIIKRKKFEKDMTFKIPDKEKHYHREFLKLKKGRTNVKKRWFVSTGQ